MVGKGLMNIQCHTHIWEGNMKIKKCVWMMYVWKQPITESVVKRNKHQLRERRQAETWFCFRFHLHKLTLVSCAASERKTTNRRTSSLQRTAATSWLDVEGYFVRFFHVGLRPVKIQKTLNGIQKVEWKIQSFRATSKQNRPCLLLTDVSGGHLWKWTQNAWQPRVKICQMTCDVKKQLCNPWCHLASGTFQNPTLHVAASLRLQRDFCLLT